MEPGSQTGSRSEGAESRVGTATTTTTSTTTLAYCVSGIASNMISYNKHIKDYMLDTSI